MQMRKVGKSGLQVSAIGLGCNNFGARIDLEASRKVIDKAIEVGITLFDTADSYGNMGGSETILGQVLGARRKQIVLATKFGNPMNAEGTLKGASRGYIVQAVEASLKRLRTDWIDLYQLHKPDPLTPMEETLGALNDLIRQGKVRYVGCSNLPAWQVVESQWISKELGVGNFVCCQDEYSLVVRDVERELIPAIAKYGLGLLPFFPLASGLLTGKYAPHQAPPKGTRFAEWERLAGRFLSAANVKKAEKLKDYCERNGHTLIELAFSWLLSKPEVSSVIAGATSVGQVEQNAHAGSWQMTPEDLAEVDRLTAAVES
ncbi:MAG TPA: aldo/keto reductase [Terriglobales bacterium]|nr:aldo/keto reductase [Terriglobales bacterium]